ncbi:MAG: cupredoxin domain-containing protein [Candidatus Peribacteraceae bacterium]|nr:cupredoxin domain-containing protein [Candidatus Peribacteraceae bacterium]
MHKSIPSLLMFLTLPLSAAAAVTDPVIVTVEGQTVVLTDVASDRWYATFIRDAVASEIVSGYRDEEGNPTGKFGPADDVTISQALKIAVLGAGYDPDRFPAVETDLGAHWVLPYLSVASSEEFTLFDQRIAIDRPATRAEVASLFADAFRIDTETSVGNRYDDVGFSTPYAFPIEALSRDGVLNGDTDDRGNPVGRFRPMSFINRAEVTKMIMVARSKYGMPGEGRGETQSSSSFTSSARSSSSSSRSSLSSASSFSSSSASSHSGSSRSGLSSSAVSSSASSVLSATVTLTDAGFSPSELRIQAGATVRFRNDSSGLMRIVSDPHPAHTDFPALDALQNYNPGESFYFTFAQQGTWGYHNETTPTTGGTVVVE